MCGHLPYHPTPPTYLNLPYSPAGTHFMPLDTDEYYLPSQLKAVCALAADKGYEGVACQMRYLYKEPTLELLPQDGENWVPVLYARPA